MLVRHGFSFDFSLYFYFYFFYSMFIGLGRFYTLVRDLGGISWVLTSCFFDFTLIFYVLWGVWAIYVTWLWLSEDSTYFYRFLNLFSISGPLVLAKNLSCYILSILFSPIFSTNTIFSDFVAYVFGVDMRFLVDLRYELLFLVEG